jgi:flavin reductase (DIM6/NTAB) family NADH-FMN oxidoreductase RutF
LAKIVQTDVESYYFGYPVNAAILTCSSQGVVNAMTLAWHTTFSSVPLQYGVLISRTNFTNPLIAESSEFVINFMPAKHADLVAKVGGCSGNDVDKFSTFGIQTTPGSTVGAPVLSAAYASYECKVVDRKIYGDHELFVGQVAAVQWEESAFSEDGTIDLEQVLPTLTLGEDLYAHVSKTVHHPRR